MQGRLEKDRKNYQLVEYKLSLMPEFIKGYYLYLKASNHTSQTCVQYINSIYQYFSFVRWLLPWEVVLDDLTYESVINFLLSIQTKKDKDGSIKETSDAYKRNMWFVLNNFFNYLVSRKMIKHNFMKDIPNVTDHDEERRKNKRIHLTAEDYKKILNVLDREIEEDITKVENKAVILLFMNTGMRRSALEAINISDIDLENRTLIVVDKGNEEHKYVLNDMCIETLREWLKVREYYTDEYDDALFVNKNGHRLPSRTIAEYVLDVTEKALGMRLGPHKLRAGFCSIMYEQTGDIEKVRRMVGHKRVATTQRYIVTDNKEKEEAADIMENLLS